MHIVWVHQRHLTKVDLMSLEHAPARSDKGGSPDLSQRAGYTVAEFITLVVPMSRGFFYQEVAAGKIRILKNGRRTIVPAAEGPRYVAALPERKAAQAVQP